MSTHDRTAKAERRLRGALCDAREALLAVANGDLHQFRSVSYADHFQQLPTQEYAWRVAERLNSISRSLSFAADAFAQAQVPSPLDAPMNEFRSRLADIESQLSSLVVATGILSESLRKTESTSRPRDPPEP